MADKKRKGASSASVPPTKKSKKAGVETPSLAMPAVEPATDNVLVTNGRATRKRAADSLEEEKEDQSTSAAAASDSANASKKSKKSAEASGRTISTEEKNGGIHTKSGTNSGKKRVKTNLDLADAVDLEPSQSDEDAGELDSEEADAGAALLTGFDSDNDDLAEDQGDFSQTQPIPQFKKTSKKLRQAKEKGSDKPGAVYVGRIPHGFYEHQMKEYFSQFGDITKLRLSRNKRTGASKHFAFIEFASDDVAKIVAETMDNYLMFGHILKCKYAPAESLHPDVWKGANKKYRRIPHDKLQKQQLEAPKTHEQWVKSIEKEQKRRLKKAEKMKAIGYEYVVPQLKNPANIMEQKRIEETHGIPQVTEIDQADAISAPPVVPVDEKAEKKKREAKKNRVTDNATRGSLTEHNLDVQDAGLAAKSNQDRTHDGLKRQNGAPPSTLTTQSAATTTKTKSKSRPKSKNQSANGTSVTSNNEFDNLSSIPVGTEAMTNHPDEPIDDNEAAGREGQQSLDTVSGVADTVLKGRKDDRKKRRSGTIKSAEAQAAIEMSEIAPGAVSRGNREKELAKKRLKREGKGSKVDAT